MTLAIQGLLALIEQLLPLLTSAHLLDASALPAGESSAAVHERVAQARERAAASIMHGELDPNVACTRSTPEEDFAGAEVRSIVRRILSEVRSPREAKAKIKKRLAS